MHPDAIIAALKVELTEARDDDHKRAIEAEMERVDQLPRPEAKSEQPETVFDESSRTRAYLDALRVELEASAAERESEIIEEIARVESELSAKPEPAAEQPAAEVPVAAQEPAPAAPAPEPDPESTPADAAGSEPESGSADAGQE